MANQSSGNIQLLSKIAANDASSFIVDDLLWGARRGISDSAGVAFFYCDGTNPGKGKVEVILGSLLQQFCRQLGFDRAEEEMRFCRGVMEPKPTLEFFVTALERICRSFKDVYIILDGLDEFGYIEHLVAVLRPCMGRCHVLVTSAYSQYMQGVLSRDASIMEVPIVHDTDAIGRYLDWKMTKEDRFRRIRPDMRKQIIETLVEKSHGR